MIYGYHRVSKRAQDLTGQLARLKAAGCAKIFRDKVTSTTADRSQVRKLLAVLKHGEVVITPGVEPILTPHQQREARARIAKGETQRSVARR
jgi:DNA invertase Pin-like site-specific DNA recombinase